MFLFFFFYTQSNYKKMEADRTEHLGYDFCNWDHFVCVTAYYALFRSPSFPLLPEVVL